jgi:hypothetical protein
VYQRLRGMTSFNGPMRATAVLALAVLAALLGAGAAQPRPAPGGVTTEQLALMVVPKSQLGSVADGLEIALGSGVEDNAAAADDSLDPKDDAAQLARAGRLTGYALEYDDLAFDSLVRQRGVVSVQTTVSLFTSSSAANEFMTKGIADATKYAGRYVGDGLYLDEVGVNAVTGLGDRAASMTGSGRFGSARFHETSIGFRTGTIFAEVTIARADAKPALDDALRIAQKLARRIGLAASGTLRERPVAVPETAKQGRPPADGPALTPMVLTPGDVGPGARVARQAYVADREAIGSFERAFAPLRLGGSVLTALESDVSLLRSPRESKGSFRQVQLAYSSPDLARLFTDELGSPAEVELHEALPAGDDAIATVIRARVNGRDVRLMQAVVRVGPILGFLNVAGPAASMRFDDVRPLVAKLARRIAAGL